MQQEAVDATNPAGNISASNISEISEQLGTEKVDGSAIIRLG